jgi:putative endonuclease
MSEWYTYILSCRDSSFYVGITNDLDRRLAMHNQGIAATWTRDRRPVRYAYAEKHANKSDARRREIELKGWRREKKKALFSMQSNIFKSQ